MRYHPDKHRGNELEDLAREKLAQINAAFDVLKDKERRAVYDRTRQGGAASSRPGTAGPRSDTLDPAAMVRSTLKILLVLAIVFFSLRFIRSPRALLVIGAAILIAWFLPRLFRKFRGGQ
jgi:curved DNA-binding protein CbpA